MFLPFFLFRSAGFKSRVRYISVLDPANMCYYVSEILDAGRDGPLFMVMGTSFLDNIFLYLMPLYGIWSLLSSPIILSS